MNRLQSIRLTHKEQMTAQMIGAPVVLLFVVLSKLLWKAKRWLALFTMVLFIGWSINFLAPKALGPRANATEPVIPAFFSQREEVKQYIRQVFGDQANNAFKVLACENHSLNPDAVGHNSNGTIDVGIFQVNSVHGVPEVYLKDWRTNVDVAYQIYKDSGWGAWSCVTVYHALERNDSI